MFAPLMRYFVEVAREGSVRGASEKLHIAASAINRHILEYEEHLGTPLFERLPRGMRLTEAGRILFDAAKKLQQDYSFAVSEVDLLRQAKRGHVSLATLHMFAEDVLPPVIKQLLDEFPGINYSFLVRSSVDVAQLVSEDDADLGLAYNPPQGSPLRILRRERMPFGVVLPRTHPLVNTHPLHLRDCAPYPLIVQPSGEMREVFNRMQSGLPAKLRPAVETESVAMFRELVLNGSCIGFVGLAAVLHEVLRNELVFRALDDSEEMHSTLCLYAKEGRQLTAAAQLLADRLMANFPSADPAYRSHLARAIRSA